MRAVVRRVQRLENHYKPSRQPLRRFRVVVHRMDRKEGIHGATCRRSLGPDGTVMEIIRMDRSWSGSDFTEEEFEAWIESCPIER